MDHHVHNYWRGMKPGQWPNFPPLPPPVNQSASLGSSPSFKPTPFYPADAIPSPIHPSPSPPFQPQPLTYSSAASSTTLAERIGSMDLARRNTTVRARPSHWMTSEIVGWQQRCAPS